MTLAQAAILGVVEGVTEFLPVSSTGHLILVSRAMGLAGEAVNRFEIVIQAGALLAVVWLYRGRVAELLAGVIRPHARGRALLWKLLVAFLPAAVAGLLLHRVIEDRLFGPGPVAGALLAGGVLMVAFERWRTTRAPAPAYESVDAIPLVAALLIGVIQCLSLWPGTSRAMVTILATLLLGCTPVAAAEFSFLLALPTLGAATLFDLARSLPELRGGAAGGPVALGVGLLLSAVVAGLAIRTFLAYLTRRGLAPFGWYRIALGLLLAFWLWPRGGGLS
jgi:undecaprenyl-diphosphatase